MRKIGVGSLTVTDADKEVIGKILDSGQISPGPYVKRFEEEFALYHGAKHGLFVNSGTDALRIALAALKEIHKWDDGDYVVLPALTFVATLNIILQNNLRPLLVDVSAVDFTMDRSQLSKLALRRTQSPIRCVIPVHLFGQPCQMKGNTYPFGIADICRDHLWKVIEDSCETMGVMKITGDIACFSTYVAHLIATGVGGLAITNNPDYAEVMRSLANHGRDPHYIPGFRTPDLTRELLQKRFKFDRIGYSSRMSEMEAALGLGQLYRLEQHIAERRRIAQALSSGLAPFSEFLKFETYIENKAHAFMMFPIVLRNHSGIDKWDLCLFLERHGIETREMLPLTNQPCYKNLGISPDDFPVAQDVNKNGFYIGCHPGMSDQDIRHVLDVFEEFFLLNLTNKRTRVH